MVIRVALRFPLNVRQMSWRGLRAGDDSPEMFIVTPDCRLFLKLGIL